MKREISINIPRSVVENFHANDGKYKPKQPGAGLVVQFAQRAGPLSGRGIKTMKAKIVWEEADEPASVKKS